MKTVMEKWRLQRRSECAGSKTSILTVTVTKMCGRSHLSGVNCGTWNFENASSTPMYSITCAPSTYALSFCVMAVSASPSSAAVSPNLHSTRWLWKQPSSAFSLSPRRREMNLRTISSLCDTSSLSCWLAVLRRNALTIPVAWLRVTRSSVLLLNIVK